VDIVGDVGCWVPHSLRSMVLALVLRAINLHFMIVAGGMLVSVEG